MDQDASRDDVATTSGATREKKMNVFARIALFIRQVFGELRKVVTPTRQELVKYTLVVLGFVVVMMALVYGLDTLFTLLTQYVFGSPE
ncbi:preprotein translocase subunit SecE [Microbacterium sp. ZW T5_56]|jgi:preprotein translocase subunit SecE|uniref:preprotein translocase subunit SecE n=1 Tax=Microbacterium sp. ZW T5_56 TaxID=3378081 RepID=UPI0038519C7B